MVLPAPFRRASSYRRPHHQPHQYHPRLHHPSRNVSSSPYLKHISSGASSKPRFWVILLVLGILPLLSLYFYAIYKLQSTNQIFGSDRGIGSSATTTSTSKSEEALLDQMRIEKQEKPLQEQASDRRGSGTVSNGLSVAKNVPVNGLFAEASSPGLRNNNELRPRIWQMEETDSFPTRNEVIKQAQPQTNLRARNNYKTNVTRANDYVSKMDKDRLDLYQVSFFDMVETPKQKKHLEDSQWYDDHARDPLEDSQCMAMHEWQHGLKSACNAFHELGLGHFAESSDFFRILADGGYNEVFLLTYDRGVVPPPTPQKTAGNAGDGKERVVLKILEYGTKYTDRNYDRVRRDAMVTERATFSKYIVDGFGHCGFALLSPLAKGARTMSEEIEDMEYYLEHGADNIDKKGQVDEQDSGGAGGNVSNNDNKADLIKKEVDLIKLKLSLVASLGLSDLHNLDGDEVSSVAHDDLKTNQYMWVDGRYKLGDFNRGRFVRKDRITHKPCAFYVSSNDAKYRAPEEYIKRHALTSKIDIWALGSIIFRILTGENVWHGYKDTEAQKLIASTNATPPLPDIYQPELNGTANTNSVHNLLRTVMYDMCFIPDPNKRSSAIEVANYLKEETKKLGYFHNDDEMDEFLFEI